MSVSFVPSEMTKADMTMRVRQKWLKMHDELVNTIAFICSPGNAELKNLPYMHHFGVVRNVEKNGAGFQEEIFLKKGLLDEVLRTTTLYLFQCSEKRFY